MPSSSTPSSPAFPQVAFAGLRFTPMSVDQAVSAMAQRPSDQPFVTFVTPNAEHAWLRRRDPIFRAHTDACWISTNDSRVVGRAARLAGLDLDFAPGAYVVRALFEQVIKPDTPLCVIGGSPDIIARLTALYGLTALAHHNPPMGFIRDPQAVAVAVDFVAAHPAGYVFVCMGPPQSELFCEHVIADGRAVGVGLCVGSSLSVLTGDSNPAPDWMENSGLVWLYRLVREPGRLWKRYLARGFYAVALAARDIVALRLNPARAQAGRDV